ncbi:MAG: class I adenylate-forming enzyme family protein [bacterium]
MLEKRLAENRWYASTVQQLFRETCRDRPDKTAIVFEDRRISFAELQWNVDRCSWALLNLGVRAGDHVAVIPTPSPEFSCLYFGALQIGAVVNPLNLLWGTIEYAGILERNDPRIIVTIDRHAGRDYVRLLRDSIPDLEARGQGASSARIPTLTHLVTLSRQGHRYAGCVDYDDLLGSGKGFRAAEIAEHAGRATGTDLHSIMQTSGSTGLSKSVLLQHRSVLAAVHFAAKAVNFREEDTYINLGPFYHNTGIFALNLNLALAGTTLYLLETFDPIRAVEWIDREQITTTFGFDAHWQAMRRVLDSGRHRFAINKAICAVQPQTFEMIHNEMCKGKDAAVAQIYAQTENGPGVSMVEPDCLVYELRKYSNGRPMAGVEVVIKDIEGGAKLPPHKPGEICYRGPCLFKGYYKQEEETKRSFDAEGYFHSGDYGTFENGYVHFLGRLGGVVKSGGENVSTTYVSALLLKLLPDEFEDVQTVGVPDPYWGTRIVSFVRMKAGKPLRPLEQIKAACKGRMAQYEIPKEVFEWHGPWPVTSIGKLDLGALQAAARTPAS